MIVFMSDAIHLFPLGQHIQQEVMTTHMVSLFQIFQLGNLFHHSIRGHITSLKPASDGVIQRPLAAAGDH